MSTQTQSESIAGSSPKGSLQSLNFGMFSVDQLATLINWGNESDYKPPICNPWVKIDLAEEPSPHAPIRQPAEPTASAESAAEPPIDDAIADADAVNDPVESGSTDTAATASDVSAEHVVAATDSDQSATPNTAAESVEDTFQENTAEENTVQEAAAEVSVEEHAEAEPEPVEDAVTPAAETGDPASVPEGTGKAPAPKTATVAVEEVSSAPVQSTSVGIAAEAADSVKAAAVRVPPTTRTSFAKPMIMNQARQQRPPMSDDYLKRLESLVLELNMQLARVSFEGEDSGIDYTQWLSQRVIDLSLENMSLQEELQKLR